MSRPLQDRLKAKRSAKATERSNSKSAKSGAPAKPTASNKEDGNFVELEWETREPTRPTNRHRAVLGVVIGLLLAWWAALGWLVWDSLV